MEPETLWFSGWPSIHWATPARAQIFILKVKEKIVSSYHSLATHLHFNRKQIQYDEFAIYQVLNVGILLITSK